MDNDVTSTDAIIDHPRAGLWRRGLATLIDSIVVIFPFQILAAVLFAMTAGAVQMNSGFYNACAVADTIPQALDPPPPHDSNYALVCHTSFFGAPTGITLTVGRITREGTTKTTVSQGYMVDKDGAPIHGTSIDEIVGLAFLAYLVGMVWKTGKTVGARIVGIRVVDVASPNTSGVPLRRAIIRYPAMMIGTAPALAVLIYQYVVSRGVADAMFTADLFRWVGYTGGISALWMIVLIFQIARKSDPVYDRLAGTAVLRDRSLHPDRVSTTPQT
jgi:uncharacterized RDD family membrane protein YckC